MSELLVNPIAAQITEIDYRSNETAIRPLTDSERELATEHYDLVEAVVRSIIRGGKLVISDVEQAIGDGMVGLCQATKKYDQAKGERFAPFAQACIRGAVIDAQRVFHKVDRKSKQARAASLLNGSSTLPLDRPLADDTDVTLSALLASNDTPVEAAVIEKVMIEQRRELFEDAVKRLTPLQQEVLVERAKGVSQMTIGKKLGVTEGAIAQVERRAIRAIRRIIANPQKPHDHDNQAARQAVA